MKTHIYIRFYFLRHPMQTLVPYATLCKLRCPSCKRCPIPPYANPDAPLCEPRRPQTSIFRRLRTAPQTSHRSVATKCNGKRILFTSLTVIKYQSKDQNYPTNWIP